MKPFPSLSYNLKASFSSFWTARGERRRRSQLVLSRVLNANQSLTSFLILLNDELSGENDKLFELQTSGFVFINLFNHLLEGLLVEWLSHQSEDFLDGLGRDGSALLAIEAVEGILQDCKVKRIVSIVKAVMSTLNRIWLEGDEESFFLLAR